ncbi:HinT-interacting membrane complex lipoprotein P60 [Mycoplasma sp. 327]
MKKLSKVLLSLSPLIFSGVPLLVSCANNKSQNNAETPGYQSGFLKQQTSKNQMILSVVDTYLEKFYVNDLKNINQKDKIAYAIENKNNQLHKDLYDLFKYYASVSLNTDAQKFWNLKHDFIRLNIDTKDYNPAPENIPSEDEFIFLMKNSKFLQENLRLELEKMLVSKIYLLKSRDEFKKLSVNQNGLDKYQVSLEEEIKKDSTTLLKKDIYDALDFSSNNLYLIKYLLENPLIQRWSFTDTKDMNLRIGKANISTFNDFNDLASYNPKKTQQYDYNPVAKYPEYILKTGASEGFELKTLRAFNGIVANSETTGDLSNSFYTAKKFTSPVFGFVDPKTKKVLDQDYFKLAKILAQEKKLPKIKATASLKSKQDKEENLKVFNAKDIEFEGLTRQNDNEKVFTKEITLEDKKYTLMFELKDSITFSGQILRAPMRLSIKELGSRHYYDFSAELEYKDKKFIDQTNANDYNLDKYPTFIDVINDKKIDASYVIKLAPLYLSKKVKNLKNEIVDKKIFTFENTPWNDATQQSIIANYIVVSKGNTLFREANKYIIDNLGFKLTELNPIVLELFKVEGLI